MPLLCEDHSHSPFLRTSPPRGAPALPHRAPAMELPAVFPVERRRFLQLALYCAISFLWAGTWICLAPIADVAEERFQVGPGAINAFASSYMWMYVPGSLLCLWTVDRFGVRVCLAASITVNAAVVVARYAALGLEPHAAFWCSMLAQLCAALAQAMAVNLPARVAADWFPATERDGARAAASVACVQALLFSLCAAPSSGYNRRCHVQRGRTGAVQLVAPSARAHS